MATNTANSAQDWASLIQQKQADRESRIPNEWRLPQTIISRVDRDAPVSGFDLFNETAILTEKERYITEAYDATGLLEQLSSGSLTSLEVTTAFCKRAAVAHQLINPLTEVFFDVALKRARECDAFMASNGKPMGRFHGLPISLKDMFMVKGQCATIGFVSYLNKPTADYNSAIVDILYNEGAVFYCKTTVPQGLFTLDSENRIFGRASNPQRLDLTAGGSSSGEGALVAFRGSPLGIGTDIGGSIRCPSFLNGCYGFKPTSGRLPYAGQQYHFPEGWPGVAPAVGPHANSARDLTTLCRKVIQAGAWEKDHTVSYKPWRDVPRKQKLRVGMWSGYDEVAPRHPTIKRTLDTAANSLRAAGHDVIDVASPELSSFEAVIGTYTTSISLDADNTIVNAVLAGQEEMLPSFEAVLSLTKDLSVPTLASVWAVNAQKGRIAAAWHNILRQVDVLLCPAYHSPGIRHGPHGVPAEAMVWNLIDCPATVIPFLKGDDTIDKSNDDYESFHGISSHIQVVGWTGQDEEVLMATELISDVFHQYESQSTVKPLL
ncbi:hypothetical protein NW768_011761 [Fusarium equiseti]|uniref:amidase n=1 Tax=Fusarium equiseti TaxID=61235 RepID=A0ABQ8QXC5_FUSEQ|nr:hypothetical protein NW768_011761 [Fusarium equiseti]